MDSSPITIVRLPPTDTLAPPAEADLEALGDTSLYAPQAIARALAHIALWKQCAASTTPLTICDADAVLHADFEATSARLLRTVSGYDYVLWGWRPDALVDVAALTSEPSPILLPLKAALGVVCYTLSPEGARRLLEQVLPLRAFTLQLPLALRPRGNSDLDAAVSLRLGGLAAFASTPPLASSSQASETTSPAPGLSREAALRNADLLQRDGRTAEALIALQAAAESSPDNPVVLGKLGAALAAESRFAAAAATLERALALDDRDDTTAYNLATLRLRQQRHADALALLGRVLARNPEFDLAHSNVGVALLGLGRHAEAEDAFRRALALQDQLEEARRGLASALVLRSGAHEKRGEFANAQAAALEATRLQPDLPAAFNNLGVAFLRLGQPTAAEDAYRSALALVPDYADAHYGLAFALLNQGRFRDAWPEYDWRLKTADFLSWTRALTAPRWDGTPAPEATLLLLAEQGLGDTIMTARFIALAQGKIGRIILRVPRTLVPVLGSLPGVDAILADDEPAPAHDLWCPLMSLPGLLGVDPTFTPERVPMLAADPDKVRSWGRRLPLEGLRVGIAWQGNRTARVEFGRSIPLSAFKALATIPGVRLVSLQKGDGVEQLGQWDGDGRPLDLGDAYRLGDFADTAAAICNLDLVITCDTSVAHISSALGRPTWIAIGAIPDWRWLKNRDDSIWYRTARLYRLGADEAWDALFGRIAAELRQPQSSSDRSGRR